jgi:hypothetical protein
VSYWFNRRDAATRSLLTQLITRAGVHAQVRVSEPQVEAPLLLSPRGAVITLLNFQSSTQPPPPVEQLGVSVTLPFEPNTVESAEHAMLNFTSDAASNSSHVVSFSLPLGFGDFVAIKPAALL